MSAEREQQWAEAAPKMAAALSEVGYPSRYNPFSGDLHHRHEIEFLGERPPADVLRKAALVCGLSEGMADEITRVASGGGSGTTKET